VFLGLDGFRVSETYPVLLLNSLSF